MIDELKGLKDTFGLEININKSKFITDKGSFKDVEQVGGIQRVSSFKYLGVEVTLTKRLMVKETMKNLVG